MNRPISRERIPEQRVQRIDHGRCLDQLSLFFFYSGRISPSKALTELEDLRHKNYAKSKEIGWARSYPSPSDTHFVHKAWHDANEKIAKSAHLMLADPTALLAGRISLPTTSKPMAWPSHGDLS